MTDPLSSEKRVSEWHESPILGGWDCWTCGAYTLHDGTKAEIERDCLTCGKERAGEAMSEVSRWMIGEHEDLVPCVGPFRWGPVVVLASDYDALAAENARLRDALARETKRAQVAEKAADKLYLECCEERERSIALWKRLAEAVRLLSDAHAGAPMTYWHDVAAFLAARETERAERAEKELRGLTDAYDARGKLFHDQEAFYVEQEKRMEEAVRLLRLHLDAPHMDHRSEVEAFLAAHEPNSPGTLTVAVHYGAGGDGGGSDPVAQGSNVTSFEYQTVVLGYCSAHGQWKRHDGVRFCPICDNRPVPNSPGTES